MYLLGYDIGSSSIKAALVSAADGKQVAVTQQPKVEMAMAAPKPGWAEQHPEDWWKHVCTATRELIAQSGIDPSNIEGIGIAYQMHGLVMLDKNGQVLRPSIIWCDSRAVEIGDKAFADIGEKTCLSHLLNAPGNFTASKLKWVKDHEPELYRRCYKVMLPGDYIAYRLTGQMQTTISGLSEGILWDFQENDVARLVLDHYGFDDHLLPELVPTTSVAGRLSSKAAEATGLVSGIPVSYRAGDQPNNALSLNVLHPGEIAATGGTSGVVYGVIDQPLFDPQSRVNGFAHVNHTPEDPHIGILLCINGTGIQYGWVRNQLTPPGTAYEALEAQAKAIPIGADGLIVTPFGNGAERMLGNRDLGASLVNLQFNRHEKAHLYRATLEGIAFAFVYGIAILEEMGLKLDVIRVGNDNLFQSDIFTQTIATLTGAQIEMAHTTGAIGAALAAGVAPGVFDDLTQAMGQLRIIRSTSPDQDMEPYQEAYGRWEQHLVEALKSSAY